MFLFSEQKQQTISYILILNVFLYTFYRYMHDRKGSHFGQQKSFESVILSDPTEALTTSDFLVGITKGLL